MNFCFNYYFNISKILQYLLSKLFRIFSAIAGSHELPVPIFKIAKASFPGCSRTFSNMKVESDTLSKSWRALYFVDIATTLAGEILYFEVKTSIPERCCNFAI